MACPVMVGAGSNSWQRIALSPDASTLWVSHVGVQIDAYTYPGLSFVGTEVSGTAGMNPNFLAVDDAGDLYWAKSEQSPDFLRIYRHTPGGSSSLIHSISGLHGVNDHTVCWSPYDGNLYLLDQDANELSVLNLTTSIRTVLCTLTGSPVGSGAGQTQPVPTLDGGIWFATTGGVGSEQLVVRWDIPSGTLDSLSQLMGGNAGPTVAPRPDGTVVHGVPGTEVVITWDGASLSESAGPCGAVPQVHAVAYTPDLSTVAFQDWRFGLGGTAGVWSFADIARFWLGKVGFRG